MMDNKRCDVSFIVPFYNAEKTLEKCLTYLTRQHFLYYEIILIDDGSDDDSVKVIEPFLKKYEDLIRYFKKEHSGVADSRNLGIDKARGKYIIFSDADDYVKETYLISMEEAMQQDIDVIKCKAIICDEQGNEISKEKGQSFKAVSGQEAFNRLYSSDKLMNSLWLYAIKKEIFDKNNLRFLSGSLHEDFGLVTLILLNAKTVTSMDNYQYYYVQTKNSIMRNEDYEKTKKKAYDMLAHYDRIQEEVKKYDISDITRENVGIYCTNSIILTVENLKGKDKRKYIKEIKNRDMIENIKPRNLKQKLKRIILSISIPLYLSLREQN